MEFELFTCGDEKLWRQIYDQYSAVLKKKADNQKKSGLVDLDKWYQNELPKKISSRSPRFISKEEITQLMKWKLMRGKFRPRLTELIQQNSENGVKDISEKAFQNYKNVREAIKELSKLKAVGPATASAIMAASSPQNYPFMADEVMESIPGFKIAYTLPAYIRFQESLNEKAKELRQDGGFDWTPHKVELALWTNKCGRKFGLDLIDKNLSITKDIRKKKREIDDNDDDDDDNDDDDDDDRSKKIKSKRIKVK